MGLIGRVANVSIGYAKCVFLGSPAILTLNKLAQKYDFYKACIGLLNKLVFSPSKAYYSVNGNYYDFASGLDNKLSSIRRQVLAGGYQFSPYEHKIVKLGYKHRDIYLASWADKFVERWIACGLNKLLSNWFSDNCYAYRPGKFGLDHCQRVVARGCSEDMFVIRRDISNYFYSIPHDKLIVALSELIDHQDPLFHLIEQRIRFKHSNGIADIGVPFGSPIACVLANIYLTKLDRSIEKLPVRYYRYADDFLIIANDLYTAMQVKSVIQQNLDDLGLKSKESHTQNLYISASNEGISGFAAASKFKFLGLEFKGDGTVRLGREKQRKIINLFKREFKLLKSRLKKMDLKSRIKTVVDTANDVLSDRIRSAAIVDYYLKHINDEDQLKNIDLLIAQSVISTILDKPFRYRDFSIIRYKALREAGLISLVHRHRLHKHGHLKINFLSLYNELVIRRHNEALRKRHNRIQQMSIIRKLRYT